MPKQLHLVEEAAKLLEPEGDRPTLHTTWGAVLKTQAPVSSMVSAVAGMPPRTERPHRAPLGVLPCVLTVPSRRCDGWDGFDGVWAHTRARVRDAEHRGIGVTSNTGPRSRPSGPSNPVVGRNATCSHESPSQRITTTTNLHLPCTRYDPGLRPRTSRQGHE